MSTTKILIAGFGGPGVRFAGKYLAYQGLLEGRQLSWLPSYGPEMRGGTANCSVILSDEPVGSPIVTEPDVLIVMNLPSYDKYESSVVSGGLILLDSSLIDRPTARSDVRTIRVPATAMAREQGIPTLANMILLGQFFACSGAADFANTDAVLKKVISQKHMDLFALNRKALELGYHYQA